MSKSIPTATICTASRTGSADRAGRMWDATARRHTRWGGPRTRSCAERDGCCTTRCLIRSGRPPTSATHTPPRMNARGRRFADGRASVSTSFSPIGSGSHALRLTRDCSTWRRADARGEFYEGFGTTRFGRGRTPHAPRNQRPRGSTRKVEPSPRRRARTEHRRVSSAMTLAAPSVLRRVMRR